MVKYCYGETQYQEHNKAVIRMLLGSTSAKQILVPDAGSKKRAKRIAVAI
jgi:hypothetical protein